jgi:hypothetical protein
MAFRLLREQRRKKGLRLQCRARRDEPSLFELSQSRDRQRQQVVVDDVKSEPRPMADGRFGMRLDVERRTRWEEAAKRAGLLACDEVAKGRITVVLGVCAPEGRRSTILACPMASGDDSAGLPG